MNILANAERSFHRTKLKFPLIKLNRIEDREFLITISHPTSDFLRITIVNERLLSESYTSEICRQDYEDLKSSQNLLIDYLDFPKQLMILLTQYEEGKLKMRLVCDNTIKLVFYTSSDVKELVILEIPFDLTSQGEIIVFLQKRHDYLEAQCKNYLERLNTLQERHKGQNKSCQDMKAALDRTYEEKQNLEAKYLQIEQECGELRKCVDELNKKNQFLLEELDSCQTANSDLNLSVTTLRSDIDSLKIGIEYYVQKTTHLQNVLAEKEKSTVPAEKYIKLNNMFCSAIADLLKCQLNLKQILSQHEFQRSENCTLKEELTSCIDMIKGLETKLKDFESNKYPLNATEEKYDMLGEMIRKLELQNAAKAKENQKK